VWSRMQSDVLCSTRLKPTTKQHHASSLHMLALSLTSRFHDHALRPFYDRAHILLVSYRGNALSSSCSSRAYECRYDHILVRAGTVGVNKCLLNWHRTMTNYWRIANKALYHGADGRLRSRSAHEGQWRRRRRSWSLLEVAYLCHLSAGTRSPLGRANRNAALTFSSFDDPCITRTSIGHAQVDRLDGCATRTGASPRTEQRTPSSWWRIDASAADFCENLL